MAGLEPVTSAVTGQRSNQLSYTPALGAQNLLPHDLFGQRFCLRFSKKFSDKGVRYSEEQPMDRLQIRGNTE